MANMKAISQKQVDDATVTIYEDIAKAYYVGKKPDENLESFPMGAFRTIEAAKEWADEHFEGGSWS